jgi:3-dehydroquinate dehydratase / shikimate dehydrogenase
LTGRPRVCLRLAGATLAEDLRTLDRYRAHVDMVELRADLLAAGEAGPAAAFPSAAGLPTVLAVRRARDGGGFTGSEADRRALLGRLLGGGFAFVELDEDLHAPDLEARAARAGTRVVRSLRDAGGVPADLADRMRRLRRSAAELPKAEVLVRGSADLVRLVRACGELGEAERIVAATGDFGFPSVVLAAKLGSAACCVSAPCGPGAAGMPDPCALDTLYRVRRIGPATRVFGVIGNPVMHSLSPLIHNRGFAAAGLDAVYLPFPVDDLPAFLEAADLLGVQGISVTVPWKEELIRHLARRDAMVEAVGACNTAVRSGDGPSGGWIGSNTDVEGFLAPLRAAFGGEVPRGLRATVIGAGGASRAVLHALAGLGADVLLLNRTVDRARGLARAFPVRAAALDGSAAELARGYCDLVVQATSAGMEPRPGVDPFPGFSFSGREVVYDLVYAPRRTAFLERAAVSGCRIIPGIEMLIAQARLQFRAFTSMDMPAVDLGLD